MGLTDLAEPEGREPTGEVFGSMRNDGALGDPAERAGCQDAQLLARAGEKRRERWLLDTLEQLGGYLDLAGDARQLHAAPKLVAAEGRGDRAAGGYLIGDREGDGPLGCVARTRSAAASLRAE
ncbi:MAG: hypothetical protein P4M09_16565 [Devosia sp.]|nr:hypothetical protein [Devosia sp.]